MRRREFLGLVLGASAVWPARALSQQAKRVYRIGVLVTSPRTKVAAQLGIAISPAFQLRADEVIE